MVMLGLTPLVWRLQQHPRVGMSLAEILRLPARRLWQLEVLCNAVDRLDEEDVLKRANKRAAAEARDLLGGSRG